jgi:hypothetical protein
MQDCIGFSGFFFEFLDGLFRREDHKFDLPALGFLFHFVHHRQRAGASANH